MDKALKPKVKGAVAPWWLAAELVINLVLFSFRLNSLGRLFRKSVFLL